MADPAEVLGILGFEMRHRAFSFLELFPSSYKEGKSSGNEV